mmetsp:Transcript_33675/g.54577  ORF Transcript_33675/g.54577 Transcript_33675/m.54577 type:complete len:594 (+) Transcript_33675:144-1925(+)|eukprot:CAMPEP_0184655106 /NCGR_PEP_ID=MMETSP0308-20130426/12728_1 /TAXON_ID=38269 /ORGANISM="Gloeochaete witrockiana, Strain SAG 46.84" /LENGTH=593 /DNA_ID=CAMNT_0027091377 /DNA_START=100 /DNA_END=1881 /DNA_ORIENTATION=+
MSDRGRLLASFILSPPVGFTSCVASDSSNSVQCLATRALSRNRKLASRWTGSASFESFSRRNVVRFVPARRVSSTDSSVSVYALSEVEERPAVAVAKLEDALPDKLDMPSGGLTGIYDDDPTAIFQEGRVLEDSWLTSALSRAPPVPHPLFQAWQEEARREFLASQWSMPTRKTEGWRQTMLKDMQNIRFAPSSSQSLPMPSADDVSALASKIEESLNSRAVIVNGRFSKDLSSLTGLPEGVKVGGWEVMAGIERTLPILANAANWQDPREPIIRRSSHTAATPWARLPLVRAWSPFVALNQASFEDVVCVFIPKDCVCETPIHLVNVCTSGALPTAIYPRTLVILEEGSSATVVEEYVTLPGSGSTFVAPVSELHLDASSTLNHIIQQNCALDAFVLQCSAAQQEANSNYSNTAVGIGGQIYRMDMDVTIPESHTETTLNGLNVSWNKMTSENHSRLMLSAPNCKTRQFQALVATDRGKVVFSGKVQITKQAQKTDGDQMCRSLIMGRGARVEMLPQMEVQADDVKCTHGATCADIDPESLFYLQTRGLDVEAARELCVVGFAVVALEAVPFDDIRTKVKERVRQCVKKPSA